MTRGLIATLAAAGVVLAPLALAEVVEQKGLIFAHGKDGRPVLRAEPRSDAPAVGNPPQGARLRYSKAAKNGAAVEWYFVSEPGLKEGWLPAAEAATQRPIAPPPGRPLTIVDSKKILRTETTQTAAGKGIGAMAIEAGKESKTVDEMLLQFATWEEVLGIAYRDVPHRDKPYQGLYATHKTPDGRMAAADAFAADLKEGD